MKGDSKDYLNYLGMPELSGIPILKGMPIKYIKYFKGITL
jgi:hypothetical protein